MFILLFKFLWNVEMINFDFRFNNVQEKSYTAHYLNMYFKNSVSE